MLWFVRSRHIGTKIVFSFFLLLSFLLSNAFGKEDFYVPPTNTENRSLFLISDLHMGLGKSSDGKWNPTEDFRWAKALEGYLAKISSISNSAADLVIVGDFLELWQPPSHIKCSGFNSDLGCTEAEMGSIIEAVISAHRYELNALQEFSKKGSNRLHIIPGNHDSSLTISSVWRKLFNSLDGNSGRINLVKSGIWESLDKRILVEHGHQIGNDVNGYENWPSVIKKEGNETFIVKPWGEQFVQKLFNSEEANYSIIDNLSPEIAGAKFRFADKGLWKSTVDVARFIKFNVLETSIKQRISFLGEADENKAVWSFAKARKLKHQIFLSALDANDPLRLALEEKNESSIALIKELDKLSIDLLDEELTTLCDAIAFRNSVALCQKKSLGATVSGLIWSHETKLKTHIKKRRKNYPDMRMFIYGHTHKYEQMWPIKVSGSVTVDVLNTGAFQRLVDEAGFLQRAENMDISAAQGLRKITVSDLAPCYNTIIVEYDDDQLPVAKVTSWKMDETNSNGEFLDPTNVSCR